jgi:hypothetical protein
MNSLGWGLIVLAAVIALFGVALLIAPSVPWLGRLPGDIVVRGRRTTFYFPIVTCLLLSLALSAVLWLANWLRR